MPKAKKVLKEFVLDSDTDSATSKTKQDTPIIPKEEEAQKTPTLGTPSVDVPPIEDVPKEIQAKVDEIAGEPKVKKPRKAKEPKEPKEAKVLKEPKVPKAPKAPKAITQQQQQLTEAQIRSKIEKEYKEKEAMKTKMRRELEKEYQDRYESKKVSKKRPQPIHEEEEEVSLGDDDSFASAHDESYGHTDDSEIDFGQSQIEKGNRKAPRVATSVELMRKQIFGK